MMHGKSKNNFFPSSFTVRSITSGTRSHERSDVLFLLLQNKEPLESHRRRSMANREPRALVSHQSLTRQGRERIKKDLLTGTVPSW